MAIGNGVESENCGFENFPRGIWNFPRGNFVSFSAIPLSVFRGIPRFPRNGKLGCKSMRKKRGTENRGHSVCPSLV